MSNYTERLALFLDENSAASIRADKSKRAKFIEHLNLARLPLDSFRTLVYMYDVAPMNEVQEFIAKLPEMQKACGSLNEVINMVARTSHRDYTKIYIDTGIKFGDLSYYVIMDHLSTGYSIASYGRIQLVPAIKGIDACAPTLFNESSKSIVKMPDLSVINKITTELAIVGELYLCPAPGMNIFGNEKAAAVDRICAGKPVEVEDLREKTISKVVSAIDGNPRNLTYDDLRSPIYTLTQPIGVATRGMGVRLSSWHGALTFKEIAKRIGFTDEQLSSFKTALADAKNHMYRATVDGIAYQHVSYNTYQRLRTARFIGHVEEANNHRLAVVYTDSTDGTGGMIVLVSASQPFYNNLDEGNMLLSYGSVFDTNCNVTREEIIAYINNDHRISGRVTREYIDSTLLAGIRRARLLEDEQKQQLEMAQLKVTRLANKLREVASGDREYTNINSVKYTATTVENDGVVLELPKEVMANVYNRTNITALEDVEFNVVLRHFLELGLGFNDRGPYAGGTLLTKGSVTVRVNNVTATITHQENARGYTRLEINGKRVNKSEVIPVLLRMICFDNLGQAGFDAFVDSVSHTSLQLVRFLANGLEFSYTNPFIRTNNTGLLNLARKKNINYIVLKKPIEGDDKNFERVEVKVNDTTKLLTLASKMYRAHTITQVVEILQAATELSEEDCRFIIRTAGSNYLEAVRKSEELLKKTMEKLKVTKVNPHPAYKTGVEPRLAGEFYKVTGKSGNEYFIEDAEAHGIFQKNGAYICIVDKGAAMQNTVGRDRLVARMYAVFADSQTVNEIHTLRGLV